MLRVTKIGDRIAFSTLPSELANEKMFEAMAKHIPFSPHNTPPSPMQWGNPRLYKTVLVVVVVTT